ncbi:MAG: hypothetical protein ABIT05_02675 [Chitinophagaceae bacterium]
MKNLLTYLFLITVFISTESVARENPDLSGKLYFSNQPFSSSNAGNKNSFSSKEFIYGRVELNGTTIKEAFKLKDGVEHPYLQCSIFLFRGEKEIDRQTSMNYFLLKEEEKSSSSLNFDIMSEAEKSTTVYSMMDDFSLGLGFNILPGMIINKELRSDKYTVRIRVYSKTLDAWGKEQPEEKWPFIEDEFVYNFNEDDAGMVIENNKRITSVTRENAFRYDKLPPVFSNPAKLTDPNASAAKITAILKRDLPERIILKWVVEKVSGLQWHIDKDELGLPRYKYFNPEVYVAYKMNGKCYVGSVTLRQPYAGGGTYGPLQVGYTTAGEQHDKGIDCAKVK